MSGKYCLIYIHVLFLTSTILHVSRRRFTKYVNESHIIVLLRGVELLP
jgi:hypothetical protein